MVFKSTSNLEAEHLKEIKLKLDDERYRFQDLRKKLYAYPEANKGKQAEFKTMVVSKVPFIHLIF